MTRAEIEETVRNCFRRVAQEQAIPLPDLANHLKVVDDLGFKSLDVATLTAFLESAFQVDPFSSGMATITEIQTVGDVCNLYNRCINGADPESRATEDEESDSRLQRRLARRAA